MRKEELIKQLQEHEPLLANAVSHMVEYIQNCYPAAYPSKTQTEAVNDYLRSIYADEMAACRSRTASIAVSLRRRLPLLPSVYWIVASLTDYKTYLTILHTTKRIICRKEDAEYTADFLF